MMYTDPNVMAFADKEKVTVIATVNV